MTTIGILDYGSGNILSVMAIEKVGSRAKLIAKTKTLRIGPFNNSRRWRISVCYGKIEKQRFTLEFKTR